MDGVDHQLQRRVDDTACFLRVEVFHQLHRALYIRKQRRHRLTLAFEDGLRVSFRRNANCWSRSSGAIKAAGRRV